ncbi:PIN domain-containing protein [Caulobacter sp. BK020]|uniref:PIN domain-containing protein n=1 Tax=Caulobacter sp. BK020 TaxID=2512117 RepID=UPI00104CC9F1|nr:PIN domain-containing protein [Caulobacter sp. BK020]TCS16079.1 putative nucleic acid-binding protein [Caulobacter sp. BK020]
MISLDTNVLVYVSDDDEPAKQAVASELLTILGARRQPLGLQVIGELANVLSRKLRHPPWAAAQHARNVLHAFDTFPPGETAVEEALSLMASGRLGYWDALLLTSARAFGVKVMLSEDMQDGFKFGAIEVVNPFAPDGGLSLRARELLET